MTPLSDITSFRGSFFFLLYTAEYLKPIKLGLKSPHSQTFLKVYFIYTFCIFTLCTCKILVREAAFDCSAVFLIS